MRLALWLAVPCMVLSIACTRTDSDQSASPPPDSDRTRVAREKPMEPPSSRKSESFRMPLDADDAEAGWIALFDGHSLFGWDSTSDANWSVVAGVLRADTGDEGFLLSHVPFADFELRCEYRLEKGGNSGIFLRSTRDPRDPATDCYEFNLCDTHASFPTGSLVGRKKSSAAFTDEGTWRAVRIRLEGKRITARIDDRPVLEFEDESAAFRASGVIGLQKKKGRIEFRNIALRPLDMQPLFDKGQLSGWHEVPGSKSRFVWEDDALHVTDGPGFLETRETWADFVLQGQARTNGDGLNSGIFFRALAGTKEAPSQGYEFQIHNKYEDDDPTRPADFGTGGIYRRQPARRIVADDREWFAFTLVAAGARFQSWVNGYPVVAWTDERAPDENPRRGRRLAAGHISLQGHDPTTDLQFRAFRIAPLPAEEAPAKDAAGEEATSSCR